MLRLKKTPYGKLSSKAKETYNFQKVSGKLVEYGFATNWLNVDFKSADFVAVHFDGVQILKVQLKSRITISKKYIGKDIYICFPFKEEGSFDDTRFYLIPHEKLVEQIGQCTTWLKSNSWIKKGAYSASKPSKKLEGLLKDYIL